MFFGRVYKVEMTYLALLLFFWILFPSRLDSFLVKIHYLLHKLHINTLIVVAGYKVWLHLIFFCWKSELRKIISSKTRHINLKYLEINGNFDIEFVILQKRKELVVWRLSEKCVSADHCPSWFLWRVKIYCVFESLFIKFCS